MDYIPHLFSLLFFSITAIYLFLGVYVIRVNPKAHVNRAFLLVCLALTIWSFGFAMATSASTLEIALFWRRFAALGWVSVHSLNLHFILLLTCPECDDRKKQLFFLVHLPLLIGLWVFSFSTPMALIQYDLIQIGSGWINQAVNNGWDWFYYFYYASYGLLSLVLVWQWRKKASDPKIIQQAGFLFIAILISGLLASLTDIILNSLLKQALPQLAPLFLLIPIIVVHYSVKHSDLMQAEDQTKKELFLSESDRKEIFKKLALAFCLGGVIFFLSEFIPAIYAGTNNIVTSLEKSSLAFGTGLAIFFAQKIKNEGSRRHLTNIILILSIPLITLQFSEHSAITIWVFPVLIMISSLVFTRRNLLILATIVAILTQALVWIFMPENTISLFAYDYLLRIMLFLFVFLIGFYVNRIYMTKIKENNDQMAFQKLSSVLSLDFVSLNKDNFDDKITNLLKDLAIFFEVDRTYLFLIDHDNQTMTYTHEWCNVGIDPEVGTIENIPLSVFPWWIEQLEKNKMVYIEDVSQMPPEAIEEQNQLIRQKVKSLVSLPVEGHGKIQGFIGIDSVKAFKKWSDDHLEMLNILSNLMAQGLIKKHSDEEIEFMAYYDHLTHLPNRVLFTDRLNQAIHRSKRNNTFVCAIFIDLDNFKAVNDTMGHNGGDDLLKRVGQSLLTHVRKMDTVCRFGGDEFLLMLSDIKALEDIPQIAEKIMALFEKPFIVYDQEFFITASAGVAISPLDGDDADSLIKNADVAMYKSKAKGKNQYALCTTDMKEEVQQNMILSNDLYRALERNELIVYYQPQIDLHSKKINGVEALLRWNHPKHGMISPGVFIPLAEKSSLINTIGSWVLKTACAQNKKWQDMGFVPLRVGVNLSGIQFINAQVVDRVQSVLAETKLDPNYLELEITESIAIQDARHTITILNQLKALGVTIAIDDFGTEYSSLSRLKDLPIDRIKIDMQFIQGLENNKKDQAITLMIINLAKSLGLNVIAEGVETLPQLDFLNQKMCDQVQGFYYYKPMPAEEVQAILEKIPHSSKIMSQ